MLTLPDAIVAVLVPFATLFHCRTWQKARVLLVGSILAPGRRTVAATLRVMGLSDDRNYARYHHVLNRAEWSPLAVSQVLLNLLLQQLDRGDGPLIFGIDETLERRQGPRISALGIYRDAVRSSRHLWFFRVFRPAIFTDIRPPWEGCDVTNIRLQLFGQSPPLPSRARCGDRRSR